MIARRSLIALALSQAGCLRRKKMEKQLVYKLKKPLRIATDKADEKRYMLPPGTLLYFDKSMPEGFDRFHVYINVEGVDLELEPIEREGLIAPLSGFFDEEERKR
jgi:hypothetical protein